MTEHQKHIQILKEIKWTLILFAIVAIWHIGFAFGLNGINIVILGMPLWFFVSTIGAFVIAVVGVMALLKWVYKDFDLGTETTEEGGEDA